MNLFQWGQFTAASGKQLDFKVECDALTEADLQCIVTAMKPRLLPFGKVIGVPTGGLRIAELLTPHITKGCRAVLIVDDVWTTGASMRRTRDRFLRRNPRYSDWDGFVIFARGPTPIQVRAFANIMV